MSTLACLACRARQQRLNAVAALVEQAGLGRLVDEVPELTAAARAGAQMLGLPADVLAPRG